MSAARYPSLFFTQLRASLATAMAYRIDFLIDGAMSLCWLLWSIVPLTAVYAQSGGTVAGWSLPEALIVVGWFTFLRGILEGAINPSLIQLVEQLRTGTFDFVLVKPADSQFLVSTAKFSPWKAFDLTAAIGIVVYAFHRLGHAPTLPHVALAAGLLACAALLLYSIWILVICASFWVVRLDNLGYLFNSIFDAARWPLQVFKGAWKVFFTFVVPLGIMTTYPAMAILGTLEARTAIIAAVGAIAFATAARLMWRKAVRHYRSASS